MREACSRSISFNTGIVRNRLRDFSKRQYKPISRSWHCEPPVTRYVLSASAAVQFWGKTAEAAEGGFVGLGGAPAAFGLEIRASRAADPHADFLDLCRRLELDGCATRLESVDAVAVRGF